MQFKHLNKKILLVLVLVSALFLSLSVYLTYFQLVESKTIAESPYNRRLWKQEDQVLRGTVYDKNGVVLAESRREADESQTRVYPYGSLYTHLIGYNSRTYGRSGLELAYNSELTGDNSVGAVMSFAGSLSGQAARGADLHLTIDHELQALASQQLQGRAGAVVALEPATGKVLAMVDNPSFDPSAQSLEASWSDLADSEQAPFLARATGGLYPPGSTFKVVTTAAALEAGLGAEEFDDEGATVIDGKEFRNSGGKSNGHLNLEQAFAKSSNVAFAQLGAKIGIEHLEDTANRFFIGKDFTFDIPATTSRFPQKATQVETAAAAIGQGEILVTPLNMAMVAATIANDGVVMQPYVVDYAGYESGLASYRATAKTLGTAVDSHVASQIADMMQQCVEAGTGTAARVSGLSVCGKTGTAENEKNKEHSWFIGYCEKNGAQMAVAILLEYDGRGGGTSCAPIARELFRKWSQTN